MILRRATLEDAYAVLEWRNDPVAVQFSKSGAVSREQHMAWFSRAVADPKRDILIAEEDGKRIGMVRFDHSDGVVTVSINIAPNERGKGYGTAVLTGALMPGARHVAAIDPDNTASLRLFERCGFGVVGTEDGYVKMERPRKEAA